MSDPLTHPDIGAWRLYARTMLYLIRSMSTIPLLQGNVTVFAIFAPTGLSNVLE